MNTAILKANHNYKPVKLLSKAAAEKIAAGEVIERPSSVVRELLDNSIDSGASKIFLEITNGGIDCIRVTDNGSGMTKEDLEICTHTHCTSKIQDAEDLLHLSTLGFRGEALSSINAVSFLEITTARHGPAAWKLSAGKILPARLNSGTAVEVKNLFENFPARKKFLKRFQYEAAQCKQIFIDKALPNFNIEMHYKSDGIEKIILPPHNTLKQRLIAALNLREPENLFYEIKQSGDGFDFSIVLGSPDIIKSDKRNILIFVNGRRINEYGLVQAICYGSEGYFPNGGFPIAALFLNVTPERIDFNIHPAKKEARFEDYKEIHHAISSTISNFYKQKTISNLLKNNEQPSVDNQNPLFESEEIKPAKYYEWSEKSLAYAQFEKINSTPLPQNKANCTGEYIQPYYSQSVEQKPDFKFLGQFCGTFIAVEKNDSLYIIDQHAAHERIIFEELKKHLGSSQELLIPYKIQTETDKADEIINKNIDELKRAGFHIEKEKKGSWIITAVPLRWKGTEKDLQNDLADIGKSADGIMHNILASSACRAACKDGDILDPSSAYNIALKTFSLPEPLCPHGRPLYFIIDRTELFKRIKRTK